MQQLPNTTNNKTNDTNNTQETELVPCERRHVEERTFYVARVPVTLVDDVQKISTCMHESVVRSTPFTSTNSFTFVKADVYSFCLNDRMQRGKGNLLRLEASSLCLLYASLIT